MSFGCVSQVNSNTNGKPTTKYFARTSIQGQTFMQRYTFYFHLLNASHHFLHVKLNYKPEDKFCLRLYIRTDRKIYSNQIINLQFSMNTHTKLINFLHVRMCVYGSVDI